MIYLVQQYQILQYILHYMSENVKWHSVRKIRCKYLERRPGQIYNIKWALARFFFYNCCIFVTFWYFVSSFQIFIPY